MRFFGSGTMFGIPSGATPTPVQFGVLQEVSLDFNFTIKELHGSFQFPVDIGRGTAKISGKAKYGEIDIASFGTLFFNETVATGQTLTVVNETGTVNASSPYTIQVANAATFVTDLGVQYAATGVPLKRVAALPAAGEYVVASGSYTFASAEASTAMLLSYTYTLAGTAGKSFTISNNFLGDSPTFAVVFNGKRQTNGKQTTITLNRCMSNKLSLATKLEDFLVPDFDFNAMADDAGNVGVFSITT